MGNDGEIPDVASDAHARGTTVIRWIGCLGAAMTHPDVKGP